MTFAVWAKYTDTTQPNYEAIFRFNTAGNSNNIWFRSVSGDMQYYHQGTAYTSKLIIIQKYTLLWLIDLGFFT